MAPIGVTRVRNTAEVAYRTLVQNGFIASMGECMGVFIVKADGQAAESTFNSLGLSLQLTST
jgi:DNA-binding transcriptional regulator YhcF (GntR family)